MILSCACAVACKKNDNADTSCKHEYVETVVHATCETDGYTEHRCSKCGDTYKDNETEKLGHDLTEWAQQTPATCTEAEVLERHCQRTGCKHQETKDGDPKLGHNVVWTVVEPATCTEDGTEHGACDREGCTYTEGNRAKTKLGHNYVEVPDDPKAKAATCTEDGVKVEVCDRAGCGDRKETTIFALGHSDDGSKETVIAPTCTEDGKTVRHCSRCNTDYDDDIKTKLGHDMELTQTVEVTCLNDGYELWSCKRDGCEYTEKREEEPKLDHAFNDQGKCTNGCDKTINDKLTWVNTKYAVTYNETKDRLTMVGGDPVKAEIEHTIRIPAELFKKMKNEGKTQFTVGVYKWEGTTPVFRLWITEDDERVYYNNVDHTTNVMAITDEMLVNGFECKVLYGDWTQRDPAWGGTVKCTGFDFDIEFIKPFDINDKSTWIMSEFNSTVYSVEKGKWVINDADPVKGEVKKLITIKPEVFKALPSGVNTIKIGLYCQNTETQRPRLAIYYGETLLAEAHAHAGPALAEIVITDEMRVNGYSFYARYKDNNQENSAWGGTEIVTGFDLDIEFEQKATLNSETTSYTYDDNVAYDGTVFTFNVESAEGSSANGGVYFTIGSYGVYFRGGAFRPATFNGTGAAAVSHSGQGSLSVATFNKGVQIGVSVAIKDENTVTVTVYVNGTKNCEQDITRVTGEIELDAATARVEINTSDVTKLVLIV